ncbi:MAG: signal peptidase I [Clostridiales bacterium]|nr:signal peptidase I [Clostridiales bacterium]
MARPLKALTERLGRDGILGNSDEVIREQVDRLGRPTLEMLDREIARQERVEAYIKLSRGALAVVLFAVAAIIIITNLWIAVLQVDGSSMNPLLNINEIVVAVRTDDPGKGDVISFRNENRIYIKRVIAAGGDTVEIEETGAVSVNGEVLTEPYVAAPGLGACDIEFPFQVPPGTFFVLGDSRTISLDSRSDQFGPVNREQIIGTVEFRIWPLPKIGSIS